MGSQTAWAEHALNPPMRPSWAFGGLLTRPPKQEIARFAGIALIDGKPTRGFAPRTPFIPRDGETGLTRPQAAPLSGMTQTKGRQKVSLRRPRLDTNLTPSRRTRTRKGPVDPISREPLEREDALSGAHTGGNVALVEEPRVHLERDVGVGVAESPPQPPPR